jgi:hypothetical protein
MFYQKFPKFECCVQTAQSSYGPLSVTSCTLCEQECQVAASYVQMFTLCALFQHCASAVLQSYRLVKMIGVKERRCFQLSTAACRQS